MRNGKITYFIVLFQAIFIENKDVSQSNTLFSKLVNCTESLNDQIFYDKKYPDQMGIVNSKIEHKCNHKCITTNDSYARRGRSQARFIDSGTNDLKTQEQMETPAAKFSVFNLLTGDDKDEDDKSDDDEDDDEEDDNDLYTGSNEFDTNENIDDKDVEDEDYDLNFFGDVEESTVPNKLKDENDGFLKQYNRHSLRMHNLVFPLLLAYKLKFFTVIPLFLGSLVLLVGTTGIAGFFFALFSAALGLHAKSYNH